MHATLDRPEIVQPILNDADAQQLATTYLNQLLGSDYSASNGFCGRGRWYFLIHCQPPDSSRSYRAGKMAIDAMTGALFPLSEESICEIRESVAVQIAAERGELARDSRGYLLRYQAKIRATEWLHSHLTMHFSATDGQFVSLEPPLWQFSICFNLPRQGELKPLGVIEVDAHSGQVKPLNRQQQQMIQERVRETIRHRQLAAAA